MNAESIILAIVIGYVLGSIPFGLLLTRSAGLGDIRQQGSGNIGATNVLRTGKKGLAAATLLLDGAKGAAAVLILTYLFGAEPGLVAGLAAVLGHNFPVWLRFKGGKGVATTLGVLIAAAWPVGLLACATWLAAVAIFRISSLGALVALALAPIYVLVLSAYGKMPPFGPLFGLVLVLAILGFIRHAANIKRLIQGTEPRVGRKAS